MDKQSGDGPTEEYSDPVDFFRISAMGLADKLAINGSQINEAVGILATALGAEWLRQISSRRYPTAFSNRHPLALILTTAGEHQVVEVLELASYLRVLAHVENIDQVIHHLRNGDQYDGAVMQLAFAYRLFRTEGTTALVLEPPVDGGKKADIYFERGSKKYLVECFYGVRRNPFPTMELIQRIVTKFFDAGAHRRIRVRLCLRLKASLSAELVAEISRIASELVDALDRNNVADRENERFHVSLVKTAEPFAKDPMGDEWNQANKQYGPADSHMNQYFVPPQDMARFRESTDETRIESRALFWLPRSTAPTSAQERAEKILKKLEPKLSQTKRKQDNPFRIIIADSPEGGLGDRRSWDVAHHIQYGLVPGHQGIACIILNNRGWYPESMRLGYAAHILGGDADVGLIDILASEFKRIQKNDPLRELLG